MTPMVWFDGGHGHKTATVAVAQWIRALVSQAEVKCSNPSRDRQKSLKQVVTAPLLNARK